MKTRNFLVGAFALFALVSCDNSSTDGPEDPQAETLYNVVWCASDEGSTPSYAQALTDLMTGEIDGGRGFETPSTRSAFTFTSTDGKFLYNYSYGGGTFDKFAVSGGVNYTSVGSQLSTTDAVGSAYGRCSKLSDQFASVHNIVTTPMYNADGTVYEYTKSEMKIAILDLENMLISTTKSIELPRNAYDIAENTYVWRTHMPLIQGDKIYYGIARGRALASDPTKRDGTKGRAGVLIFDYPSFENPRIVETGLSVDSDTYGYRSLPIYAYGGSGASRNDVYQLTMTNTHILKISNGVYDDSYVFSLKQALNSAYDITATGWHYAGNGIGYVPFNENKDDEGNYWGVARVDLNTKTAIRMNMPTNLDLWYYQSARLVGNNLYMAICPVDGDGNIYKFDVTQASADGFTVGAAIKGGADSYYAGVF